MAGDGDGQESSDCTNHKEDADQEKKKAIAMERAAQLMGGGGGGRSLMRRDSGSSSRGGDVRQRALMSHKMMQDLTKKKRGPRLENQFAKVEIFEALPLALDTALRKYMEICRASNGANDYARCTISPEDTTRLRLLCEEIMENVQDFYKEFEFEIDDPEFVKKEEQKSLEKKDEELKKEAEEAEKTLQDSMEKEAKETSAVAPSATDAEEKSVNGVVKDCNGASDSTTPETDATAPLPSKPEESKEKSELKEEPPSETSSAPQTDTPVVDNDSGKTDATNVPSAASSAPPVAEDSTEQESASRKKSEEPETQGGQDALPAMEKKEPDEVTDSGKDSKKKFKTEKDPEKKSKESELSSADESDASARRRGSKLKISRRKESTQKKKIRMKRTDSKSSEEILDRKKKRSHRKQHSLGSAEEVEATCTSTPSTSISLPSNMDQAADVDASPAKGKERKRYKWANSLEKLLKKTSMSNLTEAVEDGSKPGNKEAKGKEKKKIDRRKGKDKKDQKTKKGNDSDETLPPTTDSNCNESSSKPATAPAEEQKPAGGRGRGRNRENTFAQMLADAAPPKIKIKKTMIDVEKLMEAVHKRVDAEFKSLDKGNLVCPHDANGDYDFYFLSLVGPRTQNEDEYCLVQHVNEYFGLPESYPNYSFFGVYDGHNGKYTSIFTRSQLIANIFKHAKFEQDINTALREAFLLTDKRVNDQQELESFDCGTTAITVCIKDRKELIVANVGDCEGFVCRGGEPLPLIRAHRPSDEEEKARIKALGGAVVWFGTWRVNGVLAVSRSLGDNKLKHVVVAEPDIASIELTDDDEFIVCCSDGVWDVVKFPEALEIVRTAVKEKGRNAACKELCNEALKRGTQDNVTCVIIFLKKDIGGVSYEDQMLASASLAKEG